MSVRARKCVFLIGLLLSFALSAGAARTGKSSLGIYAGGSVALGSVFIEENTGGHTNIHYSPNYLLGIYMQHDFSESFGLQFSFYFQNCTKHWRFNYFDRQETGRESEGMGSFNLNALFNISRSAMKQYYLLGGIGVFHGLQFSGGIVGKFRVKPEARTFFTLAAILHLFHYEYGRDKNSSYLSLQGGLEFPLRDRVKIK